MSGFPCFRAAGLTSRAGRGFLLRPGGSRALSRPLYRSLRLRDLAALAAAAMVACLGKSTEIRFTTVSPEPPVDPVVQRPFEPAPFRIRLLLGWQYRNAVRDLLGEQAAG